MNNKCDYLYCDQTLEGSAMGLCDRHHKAIQSGRSVVGMCTDCGTITNIQDKSLLLLRYAGHRRALILIAKGCRNCQHENFELETAWINLKEGLSKKASVTPDGKLVLLKGPPTAIGGTGAGSESPVKQEQRKSTYQG